MIVIADTTPLISLMKIKHLDVLEKLFGEVQISEGVLSELTDNDIYKNEAALIRNSQFIKVIDSPAKSVTDLFRKSTGLDLGESESLILADSKSADLVLMDESHGRAVAKLMNIKVMGTIGLLGSAFKNGYLSKTEIETSILILKNSGRFISESVYEKLYSIING